MRISTTGVIEWMDYINMAANIPDETVAGIAINAA